MTEQRGRGVFEPSAQGPGPSRRDDWRATRLDPALAAARAEARGALGAALAGAQPPDPAGVTAWAAAELAVQRCLELGIDRLYAGLGAARPGPAGVPADLRARAPRAGALLCRALTAPDARARLIFVEDLLAQLEETR